jgi:hypothetical protein
MTVKRIVLAVCFFWVCAQLGWGQITMNNNYSTAISGAAFVDNLPNITNSSRNAWHNTNQALIQVSSSPADQTTKAIDSSGCVWTFPADYPAHTAWVKESGCSGLKEIVVMDSAHIYGLRLSQSGTPCTGNYYEFMWQNASTGGWNTWYGTCLYAGPTSQGVGGGSLKASSDGMLCGLAMVSGYSAPVCENALCNQGNSFQPVAGVSNGNNIAIAVLTCEGDNCSPGETDYMAESKCSQFDLAPLPGQPHGWGVGYHYNYAMDGNGKVLSCVMTSYGRDPAPTPCY